MDLLDWFDEVTVPDPRGLTRRNGSGWVLDGGMAITGQDAFR